MATIVIPTLKKRNISYQLVRADDKVNRFINGSQRYSNGNDYEWAVQLDLVPQTQAQARAWKAALAQLARRGNNFKLPIKEQSGTGTSYTGANPLVNGAGQTGNSLICDGASNSTALALAGDYMEVNGEFKVLTEDATSDSSGNVILYFEPALRASPANNAEVDIKTPEITLALRDPVAAWSENYSNIYSITLDCFEDF